MFVIGMNDKVVLVFENHGDLEGTIDNLKRQLAWARREGIEPPFLYAVLKEGIDVNKTSQELDSLKLGIQHAALYLRRMRRAADSDESDGGGVESNSDGDRA